MNDLEIINLFKKAKCSELDERISAINDIKIYLHSISPFSSEPVDCVIWEKSENVKANDYNPNKVAPPEMELLKISILNDGYTQPIVTFPTEDNYEVVDGFHRTRVAKECDDISKRIKGYVPIVRIRKDKENKKDRIASTIRHNRARGKHQIDAMSEIVIELKNRNWNNKRIARELGMDEDEVLRLLQITGLESMFKDSDFSKAWESTDTIEYEIFNDELDESEIEEVRAVNTSDENRFFHTYDKWECYKAGFYKTIADGKTAEECERAYFNILTNLKEFEDALKYIIENWKYSCEHYLTNTAMNRIAWLGQASVCLKTGVPSKFSTGWSLLSNEQQEKANILALEYLNKWLNKYEMESVDMDTATSKGRQINIY